MSKIALVFVLCFMSAWSLPFRKIENVKILSQVDSRKARSLFDSDKREFDEYSLPDSTNRLDEENSDIIETNAPSLFSLNNPKNKHFFNASVSNSKSDFGSEDWWLAGTGSYFYKPSGSELSFKTNRTNSGLGVQADGTLNLKNNHSIFGSFDFENGLGSKSGSGVFGYSHAPSGSEVSLRANKNDLGSDLTLTGKTNFLSNDDHSFRSLFTASRDLDRGTSSFGTNLNYTHNPTGNSLNFGSKYSNDGLSLNGVGNWKFDENHSLSGIVNAEHVDGQWLGAGGLNYKHKPSNSNLQLGFGNNGEGNNLFLQGDTSFGSHNQHGLSATGVLAPVEGGSPEFGGTLGYHHKPSNSNFGIGLLNKQGNPQIAGTGSFNFKNGAKLGLGGHFSKGPGFSSSGFEISGAFK